MTAASTPPRATRSKTAALAETPPEDKVTVDTPPTAAEPPHTRNSVVFCTHFGVGRKEMYPDYFFCHECDMAELDNVKDVNISRATRYLCKGGHTSFIHPSTKKKSKNNPSKAVPMILEIANSGMSDDNEEVDFMDNITMLLSPV